MPELLRWSTLVPLAVRRVARALADELDVSSVYWGTRRRRGRWTDEPCLSVEVHKKHPRGRLSRARMLPTRIDGIGVDILEVGPAIGASLSHDDPLRTQGHVSTITCVARGPAGKPRALVCGHGTLPLVAGKLQSRYDARPGGPSVELEAGDPAGPVYGQLVTGRLSSSLDFAVAEFDTNAAELRHKLGGVRPVARTAVLAANELVYHHSTLTGAVHEGLVAIGLTDQQVFFPRGGATVRFRRLFRVHPLPGAGPFGRSGDSGSLVVDAAGAAIGVLIAVGAAAPMSYVLPLSGLFATFPAEYRMFFT